jgi:MFS family permease
MKALAPAPGAPVHPGLPRVFWFLWLGTLLNRLGTFVQPFLAIYLADERKLGIDAVGRILSLVGLGALGAGPVGGMLADRLGRRSAMAVTTAAAAMAMLALGVTRGGTLIAGCAFALGFFGNMYAPVCAAIIADIVPPEHRQRAYSLRYWAANIGFAVAPVLAGLIASRSYWLLFVGDAATTMALGALVVAVVPETMPGARRGAERSAQRLATPYRHGAFMKFVLISSLVMLVFQQVGCTLPIDIRSHSIGQRQFGALIALNGVLIALAQPYVAALVNRIPRVHAMAVGAALTGVGFGLPGVVAPSVPCYAAAILVWTLGEMAVAGATPSIVADFAPAHLRGSYQGALQLGSGFAAFAAPVVGSFVLGRFGADTLWRSCLLAGLVAALSYVVVVQRGDRVAT